MSEREDALQQRKSDATSDETLDEVAQTEKDSAATTGKPDSGPSPDGTTDETDELREADPL